MADVICRWRNTKPQTVVELVNSMPHEEMDSQSFRVIMNESMFGESFLRTAYQLACQLGLYYEDGTMFHPRFDHDITEEEATAYIQKWIHRYYVPNPYTKKLTALEHPILLVESIVKKIEEHGTTDLKEILEDLFKQEMGNLDIVQNLLNVYSNVVSIKDGQVSLKENYKEYMEKFIDKNDKAAFFHAFDDEKEAKPLVDSLQRIYYGAPGTGKSYTVKLLTKGESVVRTTFHPDSDYSTFVGAYKPTTKQEPRYTSLGEKAIKMKDVNGEELMEDRIVYEFVAQAFLQAYVQAWKNYAEVGEEGIPKKQFLVIEEINRGNCAQIFGDLFQLLDRNNFGFSEYYIHADKDMQAFLSKAFEGKAIAQKDKINGAYEEDVVDRVLSGELLLLPNNLYIYATMNTSDQSLFPIDSAFKRRWDWIYVPIAEGVDKKTNQTLSWKIVIDNVAYDWWKFLGKINEQIGATTNSEDKKLGFFFCQADSEGEIDAEKFVGKVLFYLWNDVFKDYGLDGDLFKDTNDKVLTYDKFYKSINGITEIDVDNVQKFLDNLEVDGEEIDVFDSPNDTGKKPRVLDKSKYSINGEGTYKKGATVKQAVEKYVSNHPEKTGEEIINDWMGLGIDIPNLIQTEAEYLERTKNDKLRRGNPIQVHENDVIYVSNQLNVERMNDFISKVNRQDWGIHIEKVSD